MSSAGGQEEGRRTGSTRPRRYRQHSAGRELLELGTGQVWAEQLHHPIRVGEVLEAQEAGAVAVAEPAGARVRRPR